MNAKSNVAAPLFALIVVNYGSSQLLEENLATIDVDSVGGVVIVVDNFTSASELTRVSQLAAKYDWVAVPLNENRGFGGGMNAGAMRAIELGSEVLIALNPDATLAPDVLRSLTTSVLSDPKLMVAPEIRTSTGRVWFDGMELNLGSGRVFSERRKPRPRGTSVPWITGACFAMSREMWDELQGFDEEYFLYWEDVDLSVRFIAAGGRLKVNRHLVAIHDEGGTQGIGSGSTGKSENYYYYNIRNRLYFAAKHLNRRLANRWLLNAPWISYQILRAGGRRQLLQSIAPWRAYVTGLISGAGRVVCAGAAHPRRR